MDYFHDGWMQFFGLQNLSYFHYKEVKSQDITPIVFSWKNKGGFRVSKSYRMILIFGWTIPLRHNTIQ